MPEAQQKVVPPSPPLHIRDQDGRAVYLRVGFLGEVRIYVSPLEHSRSSHLGRFRKSIRGKGFAITSTGCQSDFQTIRPVQKKQDQGM